MAFLFVGSGEGKVHVFELDPSGAASPRGAFDAGQNPSFLAFHPRAPFLYAVDEKTPGRATAFAIDPARGALTRLNEISSSGDGPAHLSVHPSGRMLLTANYGSGTIGAAPIGSDGRLGAPVDSRAPGEKAHQIVTDRSGRWVLVPCLGSDRVAQLELDLGAGKLAPNAVPSVPAEVGTGPRHLAFHPDNRLAWVIHEFGNAITTHGFDPDTGRLWPKQTVSTLPPGAGGRSSAADLHVHPGGRFLYGSNRGHDSIAIFAIDTGSGALTPLGHVGTGGRSPRNFTLSADGTLLVVANQNSGNVCAFRVDAATGALASLAALAQVPSPAFVGIWP